MSDKKVTTIRVDTDTLEGIDAYVELSDYETRTEYIAALLRRHVHGDGGLDRTELDRLHRITGHIRIARDMMDSAQEDLQYVTGIDPDEADESL